MKSERADVLERYRRDYWASDRYIVIEGLTAEVHEEDYNEDRPMKKTFYPHTIGKMSSHQELQPDVRICLATKCSVCGCRAIYALGDQTLCRTHAIELQAAIKRLRGNDGA